MAEIYGHSTSKEMFECEYASREEAARDCEKISPDQEFWTGRAIPITTEQLAKGHANRIIEDIVERSFELCGFGAEDYLKDASGEKVKELDRELSEVIQDWLKRHGHEPTFYAIEDIQKHDQHLK